MKTLGKLEINHEKILENDELKSLKGGDWNGTCYVYVDNALMMQGQSSGSSSISAEEACLITYVPLFFPGVVCHCA